MMRTILIIIIALSQISLSGQQSFTLAQAINYALEHHESLQISRLDAENALWQYREAKSIGLPNIRGNADYTFYYQRPVQPTEDFLSPAIFGILFQEQVIEPRELGPPETFEFSFLRKHNLNLGITGEVLVFDGNFLKGLKAARLFIDLA